MLFFVKWLCLLRYTRDHWGTPGYTRHVHECQGHKIRCIITLLSLIMLLWNFDIWYLWSLPNRLIIFSGYRTMDLREVTFWVHTRVSLIHTVSGSARWFKMCTLLLFRSKLKLLNYIKNIIICRKSMHLRFALSAVNQKQIIGVATGRTIIQVLLLSNYCLGKFLQILMMKVGCALLRH